MPVTPNAMKLTFVIEHTISFLQARANNRMGWMAMSDKGGGDGDHLEAKAILASLANLFGLRVAAFTDGSQSAHDLRDIQALLQAWAAIEDPEDRKLVVEQARKMVKK